MSLSLVLVFVGAFIALGYAFLRTRWVFRQPIDGTTLERIGGYVAEGSMAFLKREYRVLTPFVIVVAGLLFLGNKGHLRWESLSFILGAGCSAIAGFVGMKVATAANMRTTSAAKSGISAALQVAFAGGSVMGMTVVGLALLGIAIVLSVSISILGSDVDILRTSVLPIVTGFSLGASSIALFARVGGGIFTKAADVGADLVGKVEAGIPEDDPRNPATIADNVGDNVGDVAGMGADLFESYVGCMIGCMILGLAADAAPSMQLKLLILPLLLGVMGVVSSIIGVFFVRAKPGKSPQLALNVGSGVAALLTAAATYPICHFILGDELIGGTIGAGRIFISSVLGLAAGLAIASLTEFFTGTGKKPVMIILKSCETGAATNLITGMGVGMLSAIFPVAVICAAMLATYSLGGMYGIGIAALGMLLTVMQIVPPAARRRSGRHAA